MDARHIVYIGDGSDQLCEDPLDLIHRNGPMSKQIVVKLIAYTTFSIFQSNVSRLIDAPGQYSKASHTKFSVTITSYNRAI